MTKTEKLLRELIALPSVNPAFLPPGDPHAGEHFVADFLTATAAQGGLDIDVQPVAPQRANVMARLLPKGKVQQRILLAPHMDTVGGSEMPGQLFTPRLKNGRLYGRGACDTKGCVAAMLSALMQVARAGPRPAHTEIIFAALVDEECRQIGSRALAASGFKADLAIVGEPTRLKVVTAHKGVLWLELKTHGKAAHGARPELGRNAVHAMARVVDALETDYAAPMPLAVRHGRLLHENGLQPHRWNGHLIQDLKQRIENAVLVRRHLGSENVDGVEKYSAHQRGDNHPAALPKKSKFAHSESSGEYTGMKGRGRPAVLSTFNRKFSSVGSHDNDCKKLTNNFVPCSSWLKAIHSSGVWACAISPGPKSTLGMPPSARTPASLK